MIEEMLHYLACSSNSMLILLNENGDINFQKSLSADLSISYRW
jgi:hypothetical protein